ncbi:ubiquitin carboxyl-terminal hydrolase MINDY-3 [Chrysoperla carnea]|uniref:ubiquitin carboxyl-terminal hydrolase MINDY-3 n=1 Tax=Chrysoperla carnea TaxID=189513 RepID=UPI001D05C7C8|nr:ubiquitin carboxyl-terminal hydrolase MINDY-3 [Chrysoperla carnea]
MAGGEVDSKRDLQELQFILWGRICSNETFRRWAQGFIFSETEPTALEQRSGGPCAILAPVQAYMLKYIISSNKPDEFKKITKSDQESLLIRAMVDILMQCTKRTQNPAVTLVYRDQNDVKETKVPPNNCSVLNSVTSNVCNKGNTEPIASTSEKQEQAQQMVTNDIELSPVDIPGVPDFPEITKNNDNYSESIVICNINNQQETAENQPFTDIHQVPEKDDSSMCSVPKPPSSPHGIIPTDITDNQMIDDCSEALENNPNPNLTNQTDQSNITNPNETLPNKVIGSNNDDIFKNPIQQWDPNTYVISETPNMFHQSLCLVNLFTQNEVETFLRQHIDQLQGEYGILLFLYSVLMTKGVNDLKSEIGDLSEPLIHEVYGYGSQSLVNLMLTGRAVQHVWDNDQDVGGLTLKGIDQQSEIGFVTLMEHMRYCTVGMFYKNPKYPIWVLGSETHLTVAFSFDLRLVSPEQPWETARRIFRRYDPDGSNFIPFGLLQDLLQSLGLVSDPEYVEVMRQKLDSENLGIVLLSNFLDEFYPDMKSLVPETFTLWHYNGLAGSHHKGTVQYIKGHAVLLECDIKAGSEVDQVLTCLQTKWPNVEIQWETPNNKPPSLN